MTSYTFCKKSRFLQKCLIWRLSLSRSVVHCLRLMFFVHFFRTHLWVCVCVCFGFVRFLKLNQPLKVLFHFILPFCLFLSFTLFSFFFVWCYFFIYLFLFYHAYFDKEIDKHSKADFFCLKLFSACWHNCCLPWHGILWSGCRGGHTIRSARLVRFRGGMLSLKMVKFAIKIY